MFIEANTHFRLIASSSYCNGTQKRIGVTFDLQTFDLQKEQLRTNGILVGLNEYKLLSLTYKVLTTAQPSYLHNLISLQPPCSTVSSSVVTLSRLPAISLKITDRSFRYASFRLWNQLPDSFRQPHHSCLDSPLHPLINSSLSSSPLLSSITLSLFHSRLKTYFFNKSYPL